MMMVMRSGCRNHDSGLVVMIRCNYIWLLLYLEFGGGAGHIKERNDEFRVYLLFLSLFVTTGSAVTSTSHKASDFF